MKTHWLVQALAGMVAITVAQVALSFLVPPTTFVPGLGGVLAANALTALVLAGISRRLSGRGPQRALVLWLVWGGIAACSLLEVVLFDIRLPEGHLPRLAAHQLAVAAVAAALLGFVFRGADRDAGEPAPPARPLPAWWRIVVCDVVYIALYFAAGTMVWPFVREFYEASPMPGPAAVVGMQVVRGLIFSAIVLLLVRRVRATPVAAALGTGVVFSVLGGVAPLLIANPYLPDPIRHAHLPEVGVSNFFFGAIAGWLLRPSASPAARQDAALGTAVQPLA
jgi:hypothetical protein